MKIYLCGIILLLLTALISVFLKNDLKAKLVSLNCIIGGLLVSIPAVNLLLNGNSETILLEGGNLLGIINLTIDPLSAYFLIVITLGSICCTIYAIGYMKPYYNKKRTINSHFVFLISLIVSMMMLPVVRNALAFLIIWEVMSLSSFFLVVFENEKKEVFSAGLNYLATMHISVLFLIIGFALLVNASGGSLNFADFAVVLKNSSNGFKDIIFLIFFIGFGIKAGLIPFHYWLPTAHPAAPTHVSALMSGVMIKLGIYGMVRILILTGKLSPWIGFMVLAIALLSAFIGIVFATVQTDIKRILAYSSVENIGIIVTGLACGILGVTYNCPTMAFLGFCGGLLHVFNHSLFKSLLFYSAGVVYQQTHTRNIEKLGGLAKKMPRIAILTLIGCAAISALPPLNGFIGELLIYLGLLNTNLVHSPLLITTAVLAIMILSLTGAVALFCFSRFMGMIFLGQARSDAVEQASSPDKSMLLAMSISALGCIAAGFCALPLIKILQNPVKQLCTVIPDLEKIYTPFTSVLIIFITVAIISVALFVLRHFLLRGRKVTIADTWGCGFDRGSKRMQYTAVSFSMPLVRIFNKLFAKESNGAEPKGIFPRELKFRFKPIDMAEDHLVKPLVNITVLILAKFSWIQNGNLQHYIFYGLCFLVLAIIWILSR